MSYIYAVFLIVIGTVLVLIAFRHRHYPSVTKDDSPLNVWKKLRAKNRSIAVVWLTGHVVRLCGALTLIAAILGL
jgi:hypothetical protein